MCHNEAVQGTIRRQMCAMPVKQSSNDMMSMSLQQGCSMLTWFVVSTTVGASKCQCTARLCMAMQQLEKDEAAKC